MIEGEGSNRLVQYNLRQRPGERFAEGTDEGLTGFQNVGWVEFYETHQFPRFMVGLAVLDPPYDVRGLKH